MPAQEEPLRTTLLHVEIESEAPYAPTVIEDMLRELVSTLDFTGMYKGVVKVTSPSGKVINHWELGQDWSEETKADAAPE